jgi:hypothetical protein
MDSLDSLVPLPSPSPADLLIRRRAPAPATWLAARLRGLAGRAATVALCRGELDWAWTDGRAVAAALGRSDEPDPQEVRLPHEHAAARLLGVWGHLHPTEYRIHTIMARLKLQRIAAADDGQWARRAQGSLDDLRRHRDDRRKQWAAFLAAAADYEAKAGWTVTASGWRRQNSPIVSKRMRSAS